MAARRDDWLLRAEKRDPKQLRRLLAEVMDTSLPGLEARLLALTTFQPAPAIARVAEQFFAKFPVRFREQLGTACAAVGVAWVHRARSGTFTKLKKLKAPNALVESWYALVPRALAAALGARGPVDERMAVLPTGPRGAFQDAWLELAESRNPAALDVLLERFAEGPATDVAERACALLSFGIDARIADAAAGFLERPSVRVEAEVPIFTVLALALCVHGNRSHRKAVEDLAGNIPSLRWLEAALPDVAPGPVVVKAKLANAPASEADFLRYLADAPHDDARRALFMDWLLEQGLPRGEFMVLQRAGRTLTPKETKRLAALQRQHDPQWLGSLRGGHRKGTARYRDGVLRALELSIWRGSELPRDDEPLLATLEHLQLEGGTNLPLGQLFKTARWPSLVGLTAPLWVHEQVPPELLASLTELGLVEPSLSDPRKPFALLQQHPFPKLEAIRLVGQWWRDVEGFERIPQRARLKRVEVETTTPARWFPLAGSVDRLDVLPGNSKYSEEGQRGFRFHFLRGHPLRISAPRAPPAHSVRPQLIEPLAQLDPASRHGAVLELPGPLEKADQEAFRALVSG